MSTVDSPILSAALAYAAKGWRLFPCNPTEVKPLSKSPLVYTDKDDRGVSIEGTGWPLKASLDEKQIRQWWVKRPDALIGLAPGWAGGFVVDLDPKGEPVEAVEARLVEAIGPLPEKLPRARSQSGGLHLWFARPAGEWGNEAPGLKNIDIRCDKGYVIMPPSRLVNGNSYEWLTEPFDPATAPPVPPKLLALIREKKDKRGSHEHVITSGESRPVVPTDAGEQAKRRYARAALDSIARELGSAPHGQRGTSLFASASRCGQFVACGAVSEREAIASLLDGADACGLIKDDGRKSVLRDITRGLDTGRGDSATVKKQLDDIAAEALEKAQRKGSMGAARVSKPETRVEPPKTPPEHTPDLSDNDIIEDGETLSGMGGDDINLDIVESCADLDHSDTDNAERLIRHFGADLSILAQDGVPGGDWLAWTGTHWDHAAGAARVRLVAQKLGARIGAEAQFLDYTKQEAEAIDRASSLPKYDDISDAPKSEQPVLKAAQAARTALEKRKRARKTHAVTSKNHARMEKALECAAPRLRRSPDAFNVDHLKIATVSHTLSFSRTRDLECPDPDAERYEVVFKAEKAHYREDWITAAVPTAWQGENAKADRWRKFLEEMLPDAEKRRTVQQFTGAGLLGLPLQFLMFHYGLGANGKSVFLETVTRVLGPGLTVGLPRESVVGSSERSAGAASPDLVRLYGKRMLRVLEVKGDAPLQEDLIKKLTGGESFPVRTLFKGFFEFQNFAKAHMSGNGFPTIDGTDNGIWRRMLVVHWDQTIPPEKRREFEEVVRELVDKEGPGILAWMVEGCKDLLTNGLVIAPAIEQATAGYREEMDPIGEFIATCVQTLPGGRVQAKEMYEAYVSWSMANAKRARSQTKFGRTLATHFTKSEISGRLFYHECHLNNVPERPSMPDDRYP